MGPSPLPGRAAAAPDGAEAALLERLRAGDAAAFTELVKRHGGALLRFAGTFLKDRAAAEEVTQDAWLAALDGLDGYQGRSSLRTWLFQIVANKARTRLARDGRSVPFSSLGDGSAAEPVVEPERFAPDGHWASPPRRWVEETPERLAEGAQTRAALELAIGELPAAQRAVLTLRDVEGLEAEAICNLLGITVSNQRVLLHRARARVRQALERYMAGVG